MKDIKIIYTDGEPELNGVSFDKLEIEPIDETPTIKDIERVIKQSIVKRYKDDSINAIEINVKAGVNEK